MPTSPTEQELSDMITQGERKRWEFKSKEAFPSYLSGVSVKRKTHLKKELARDIASFANTENGGFLIFGIKDPENNPQNQLKQGFEISDDQKLHAEEIIRNLITPVPEFDIDCVPIDGKKVTIFIVSEGKGPLCDVGNITYIRGVAGRREAKPEEKMRIIERRLGKGEEISPDFRLIPGEIILGTHHLKAQTSYFANGQIQLIDIFVSKSLASEISLLHQKIIDFVDGGKAGYRYPVKVTGVNLRPLGEKAQLTIWLKIEPFTVEPRSLTHVIGRNETIFRFELVLHNRMEYSTTVTDVTLGFMHNDKWIKKGITEPKIQWNIGPRQSIVTEPLFSLLSDRINEDKIDCSIQIVHSNGEASQTTTSFQVAVHPDQQWKFY